MLGVYSPAHEASLTQALGEGCSQGCHLWAQPGVTHRGSSGGQLEPPGRDAAGNQGGVREEASPKDK